MEKVRLENLLKMKKGITADVEKFVPRPSSRLFEKLTCLNLEYNTAKRAWLLENSDLDHNFSDEAQQKWNRENPDLDNI